MGTTTQHPPRLPCPQRIIHPPHQNAAGAASLGRAHHCASYVRDGLLEALVLGLLPGAAPWASSATRWTLCCISWAFSTTVSRASPITSCSLEVSGMASPIAAPTPRAPSVRGLSLSIRWNPPLARLACCLAWLPSWLARSRVRLLRSPALFWGRPARSPTLSWAWVAVSPTLSLARPITSPVEVPLEPSAVSWGSVLEQVLGRDGHVLVGRVAVDLPVARLRRAPLARSSGASRGRCPSAPPAGGWPLRSRPRRPLLPFSSGSWVPFCGGRTTCSPSPRTWTSSTAWAPSYSGSARRGTGCWLSSTAGRTARRRS